VDQQWGMQMLSTEERKIQKALKAGVRFRQASKQWESALRHYIVAIRTLAMIVSKNRMR
jgi:hypothetical protein